VRPLTILVAPDAFKGSLTSVEVARGLAEGWQVARPDDDILLAPLADGGEGTLAAIAAAGGWSWQATRVRDPLGRMIEARWLLSQDGRQAIIEMAEASGLSRVAPGERDPVGSTSAGTGDLLLAAVDAGVRSVVLGIGGSATTDGGAGMLAALAGDTAVGRIQDLLEPDRTTALLTAIDRRLRGVSLEVACDVTNPLLGASGAAATYGPQKGATPEQVVALDAALESWADVVEGNAARGHREEPGAGAAGGLGFALLAMQDRFGSFGLRSGAALVMEAAGFDEKLARADVVITGEGRIDSQTAFGKTAMRVAEAARAAGVPAIAVGGGVVPEGVDALADVGAVAVPVVEHPQTVDQAVAAGLGPVRRCGERLARLLTIGGTA
jgi:glycerate kinase